MGITLSHTSALRALRLLRASGTSLAEMSYVSLGQPEPWVGKRWSDREFAPDVWKWQRPRADDPLHVVVRNSDERVWMGGTKSHLCSIPLPAQSILWLDEHASMSAPPLLYVQMAELLSLPALVMLGYELCGHFSRDPIDPLEGPVTDGIPVATSVDELGRYLDSIRRIKGMNKAREALSMVADHAVSVPEALLATMYSLPPEELGYGMGPVTLNQQVGLAKGGGAVGVRSRYPDIMFDFGPLGINYDGEDHLALDPLVGAAQEVLKSEGDAKGGARVALQDAKDHIRAKYVDDIRRTRQLATRGKFVLPVVKEDLYGMGNLDSFTRDLLACAQTMMGVDVRKYEASLEDTQLCRDRYALLSSMLPFGRPKSARREAL